MFYYDNEPYLEIFESMLFRNKKYIIDNLNNKTLEKYLESHKNLLNIKIDSHSYPLDKILLIITEHTLPDKTEYYNQIIPLIDKYELKSMNLNTIPLLIQEKHTPPEIIIKTIETLRKYNNIDLALTSSFELIFKNITLSQWYKNNYKSPQDKQKITNYLEKLELTTKIKNNI